MSQISEISPSIPNVLLPDCVDVLTSYQQLLQGISEQSPKSAMLILINNCIENIRVLFNNISLPNCYGNLLEVNIKNTSDCLVDNLRQLQLRLNVAPSVSSKLTKTQLTEDKERSENLIKNSQVIPTVKGFNDIAGLENVKKILKAVIIFPIRQPQLYVGEKLCNSILLYGPPGTGKTRIVHAVAAEASARLFSAVPSNLLSRWVGESEKLVQSLFDVIKKSTSTTVLFIDEIDAVCRSRNSAESDHVRLFKSELLCQLSSFEDLPNVFLICATNCPWDLDPAFFRRFQRQIYIPLPSRADRFDLMKLFTKNTALEDTSNYWGPLLEQTEGYSGSDLANLVRHACSLPVLELINNKWWLEVGENQYKPAINEEDFHSCFCCDSCDLPSNSLQMRSIQVEDLLVAVKSVKPTITKSYAQKYEDFLNNV